MLAWLKANLWAIVVSGLCVLAIIVPQHLLKTHQNPPVGVYVAIMGLLAAVVTFRNPNRAEKAGWIVLLTLLMVAEIRNLYVADADQLSQFQAISNALDSTKKGLDATASGISTTSDALKLSIQNSQTQFMAMIAKTQGAIDAVTGGGSFVEVYPDFVDSKATTFPLLMRLCPTCRDSIPEATIEMRGFGAPVADNQIIFMGRVDTSFATRLEHRTLTANRDGQVYGFMVTVFANNGSTLEHLRVRFKVAENKWESSWHIEREVKHAHYNPKTRMAEGEVLKVLEERPWSSVGETPVNPAKVKVVH